MSTEAKITLYLTVEDELFDPENDKLTAVAWELGAIVERITDRVLSEYGKMIALEDWETDPELVVKLAQRR